MFFPIFGGKINPIVFFKTTNGGVFMSDGNRYNIIDELRGLAVVCMIVYHALFTLSQVFGMSFAASALDFFKPAEPYFAGLFIFISGLCSRLSSDNTKRGIKLVVIAVAISAVTIIVLPSFGMYNYEIYFGILHLLALSILLFSATSKFLDKITPFLGLIIFLALFIFTYRVPQGYIGIDSFGREIPDVFYSVPFLFFLGFPSENFFSADYFPILPWSMLFIAGTFAGVWASKGKLPSFFSKSCIVPLQWFGKNALMIYILHQPVIYGAVWVVQRLIGPQ